MNRSVIYGLLAAALFGASTPLAKRLVEDISPFLLAGILYLGSGLGLTLLRVIRDRGWRAPEIATIEWPWLLSAIGFGGVIAPVALMFGLSQTGAATASLLLNLETVLTAVIAWVVFREPADRRIVLGMLAIVLASVLLSLPSAAPGPTSAANPGNTVLGPAAVALACLCWAIDNNLTRKVSASDAVFIAACKGLIAGLVNSLIAWQFAVSLPAAELIVAAAALGFVGYGVSLVLFVLALRGLGAARTGAYFSTAPFVGAAMALLVLGEPTPRGFWVAAALMSFGVWLHLSERHEHEHRHEALEHSHQHDHDEHHQHEHDPPYQSNKPHAHRHSHPESVHRHVHAPDIHHQHNHSRSLARR
jgi:drug/metabolite transporter (DMT)-like permease